LQAGALAVNRIFFIIGMAFQITNGIEYLLSTAEITAVLGRYSV
jgi:hypothetical protein